MIKIAFPNRVYSYFDTNSFNFIKKTKDKLVYENYKISLSKLILLAVIELNENNDYTTIKQKLIQKEMI